MHPLSKNELQDTLKAADEVAKNAGALLLEHWGKIKYIREKSSAGDLVTEADNLSEELILKYLKKKFPEHAIISEETGLHGIEGVDFKWAVDPLDGTTNYTHQVPVAAISIALLYQKQPIIAVVYNPFHDEMFHAAIGFGTTLNGHKIAVSSVKELNKSLLATGFAYDRRETPDNNYAEFCYLTSLSQGIRRMGSAALDLAYLSCGRFDGFWERGLKVWDIAAGALLVTEAGGRVSSYENGLLDLESGRILASNGNIHHEMSKKLLEVPRVLGPIVW